MIRASWPTLTENLLVLDSREAILDLAPILQTLAERCGQAGAMHWLPYFLEPEVMGRRTPYLVLMLRPEETEGRSLSADDLHAAALFFEYQVFGIRTGAVAHPRNASGEAIGFSSVIAPWSERARVANAAACALVERGASIVMASYDGGTDSEQPPALAELPEVFSAVRRRTVSRALPLRPTLDATLAQMGKSTRFNLRYYRRRLAMRMQCDFIPDASAALCGEDLQALNLASLNPVEAGEFERRIRSASELPGSFLAGLRGPNGWLSLAGGWRQQGTTVLFWQMNTAGLEKASLGTVMRSYLLEHEIGLGAQRLVVHGGTPHTMSHAFTKESVTDLIVRRKGLQGNLLIWASRLCRNGANLGLKPNFLSSMLQDPALRWVSSPRAVKSRARVPLKPRAFGEIT